VTNACSLSSGVGNSIGNSGNSDFQPATEVAMHSSSPFCQTRGFVLKDEEEEKEQTALGRKREGKSPPK
jgi:hypothetical protein